MRLELTASALYDFRAVVFSHGWFDLPPFQIVSLDPKIRFALRTPFGISSVTASPCSRGAVIDVNASKESIPFVMSACRWMFRMDDPMEPFYRKANESDRKWVEQYGMGRLLRSPTVYEDLVKLILTTNCSWSLTVKLTERLVNELGDKGEGGVLAFPLPEAMARKTERFYREVIRAGYRSPYLRAIAKAVASGKLNPERWKTWQGSSDELRKEILAVPGAGPYVAGNLMRFLGRCDRLGLDSWARGKLKDLWKRRKPPTDKAIERGYREFGEWRGLMLWCDLTRDWFETDKIAAWARERMNA